MKILLSAVLLSAAFFTQNVSASSEGLQARSCSLLEDCDHDTDEPQNRVCTARDSSGKRYNYYTSVDFPITYTRRIALQKCQRQSRNPSSCRLAGCHNYW